MMIEQHIEIAGIQAIENELDRPGSQVPTTLEGEHTMTRYRIYFIYDTDENKSGLVFTGSVFECQAYQANHPIGQGQAYRVEKVATPYHERTAIGRRHTNQSNLEKGSEGTHDLRQHKGL
jgi:hypothetical protein